MVLRIVIVDPAMDSTGATLVIVPLLVLLLLPEQLGLANGLPLTWLYLKPQTFWLPFVLFVHIVLLLNVNWPLGSYWKEM